MVQSVIRHNQRRTAELWILRINPEIDGPDVASREPSLSAQQDHPLT